MMSLSLTKDVSNVWVSSNIKFDSALKVSPEMKGELLGLNILGLVCKVYLLNLFPSFLFIDT